MAITEDMVAAVPLRSLSPSEMVHKTGAEYRRAGGVCPRMPMWLWTMTLIAKRLERERERLLAAAQAAASSLAQLLGEVLEDHARLRVLLVVAADVAAVEQRVERLLRASSASPRRDLEGELDEVESRPAATTPRRLSAWGNPSGLSSSHLRASIGPEHLEVVQRGPVRRIVSNELPPASRRTANPPGAVPARPPRSRRDPALPSSFAEGICLSPTTSSSILIPSICRQLAIAVSQVDRPQLDGRVVVVALCHPGAEHEVVAVEREVLGVVEVHLAPLRWGPLLSKQGLHLSLLCAANTVSLNSTFVGAAMFDSLSRRQLLSPKRPWVPVEVPGRRLRTREGGALRLRRIAVDDDPGRASEQTSHQPITIIPTIKRRSGKRVLSPSATAASLHRHPSPGPWSPRSHSRAAASPCPGGIRHADRTSTSERAVVRLDHKFFAPLRVSDRGLHYREALASRRDINPRLESHRLSPGTGTRWSSSI